MVRPSSLERRLQPVWNPSLQCGWSSRDRASYFAAVEERCFAPEELWTRHPQFGNCGALASAEMFTSVNLFWMSILLRDRVPARPWRLRS